MKPLLASIGLVVKPASGWLMSDGLATGADKIHQCDEIEASSSRIARISKGIQSSSRPGSGTYNKYGSMRAASRAECESEPVSDLTTVPTTTTTTPVC